ncbi:MAG: 50S ribosomal protein L3 [Nitrospirae bacterium]|nr:50S ribosomal protein L3 [Candidatus Troglogloeales bacterium]MBI3598128.1 50S ribosomal protein L3 [Candidatus Troglogloeales bacterium]
MIDGLMGYKLGMTQFFSEEGKLIPVTVLQIGPCKVVQIKTLEKEGYQAAQLSFDDVAERRVTKAIAGHFKKAAVGTARRLKEFKGDLAGMNVGEALTVDMFKKGDRVDVTGVSRGKGFQGVMKRHHFRGGPATHGSMFHRAPGSIGASSFPSRVFKNQRMPGHMGSKTITTQDIMVADVRPDQNLLLLKGSVPGAPKGLVSIYRSVKEKVKKA